VTSSVTSGMATRLAAKPTSETCWKNTSVSGASPTVATAWVRRPAHTAAARRWRQSPAPGGSGAPSISRPTAPKDSQNPGCSRAHGSASDTATAAASRTMGPGQRRPSVCTAATVASIHSVRWAGTPQPASSA
jgi:hypothetical protein